MRNLFVAVALTLTISLPVTAEIKTLVAAVEASTSVMTVPTVPSGRLAFQPCSSSCDAEQIFVRLTPTTRFVVQGQPTDFNGFRKEFFNRRRAAEGYALVTYDTQNDTATSVEISF